MIGGMVAAEAFWSEDPLPVKWGTRPADTVSMRNDNRTDAERVGLSKVEQRRYRLKLEMRSTRFPDLQITYWFRRQQDLKDCRQMFEDLGWRLG